MPVKLQGKELSRYISTHMWVYRHFGKASKCEKCKRPGLPRYEWANISGEYKRDRNDFMELCQSCHKKMDHGDTCKRGHPYTKENTLIRKDGNRQCIACMKIASQKCNLKKRNNAKMD